MAGWPGRDTRSSWSRGGAQRAALTEHGLRLKVPDGESTYRLPVVEGPAELGELRADDVLVLTVKTQDVESGLAVWGPAPVAGAVRPPSGCRSSARRTVWRARASRCAASAGCTPSASGCPRPSSNRVSSPPRAPPHRHPPPRPLSARHGRDRPADRRRPGEVEVRGTGRTGRGPLAVRQAAQQSRQRARSGRGGARRRSPPGVLRAGTGRGRGRARRGRDRLCERRGGKALRGDKIRLVEIDGVPRRGGSSWQSLNRGTGTIEADYLNGEIALLGRLHGVPTPLNELLQRLANAFARERRPAGSLPFDELVRLADEAVAFVQES